jgi:hypothetical protein
VNKRKKKEERDQNLHPKTLAKNKTIDYSSVFPSLWSTWNSFSKTNFFCTKMLDQSRAHPAIPFPH